MDVRDIEDVVEVADVIQIGARNMQNYSLLAEVGRTGLPVLLKRGLSATLEELLMAAEYVLKEGNEKVMLCERGIRTFETALPVHARPAGGPRAARAARICRSSSIRATRPGRRDWVGPMSLAAAAAGADGIIVEVHNEPEEAICDGPQALPTEGFAEYAEQVRRVAEVAGKQLDGRLSRRSAPDAHRGPRRRADRRLDRARREAAPRRRGRRVRSRARERARAASSSGRSTASAGSIAEAVEGAEVVFCAAPVGALPGLVAEALDASGEDAVVTDVGSTKRELIAGLAEDERLGRFIGGHPLAGAESAGRGERARRPVRGRPLVPDADRALERRPSTTASSASSRTSARVRRRSTPRPTTG